MNAHSFTEFAIKRHYNSDIDDVLNTFYRPVLSAAISYRRAVGFFSEQTLKACAHELADFIERSGKIQLVVGCFVSPDELAAVQAETAEEAERIVVKQKLLQILRSMEQQDRSEAHIIGKLIVSGVAELRFAVRKQGLYHEKFGIFEDAFGNKLAFIGSANETAAAIAPGRNHESISVYKSSEAAIYEAYGDELEQRFNALWQGKTKDTRIYDIDKESLEVMRRLAASVQQHDNADEPALPRIARPSALRGYQIEALRQWQANDFHGILAMATGTGKTITAIEAVIKMRQAYPHGAVVITVPYQNLAVQWAEALRDHGLEVECVFADSRDWLQNVQNALLAAQLARTALPCFVCVNNSFKSDRFQEMLGLLTTTIEKNHLIIVDECHHFNSPEHTGKLPKHFPFRLGLSATPYDQYAQHYLDAYFGKIVYEFSLSRAIEEKFLTPYHYHILTARLDDEETTAYEELTRKIVQIAGSEEGFTPEVLVKVQPLLLKRSRIVGACREKLAVLRQHLQSKGATPFTLFYCGDGSVEEEGELSRQIELVTQLLHDLGWKSSRITAQESLQQRESLLQKLKERSLDAIVSIKVLDEGIDIPACRSAYLLASQTSDRQGIQRRGRVLRKSDGKESADLYDFIVLGGESKSHAMKSLAKRELRRARIFAADAIQAGSLVQEIEALENTIGITREIT